MNLKSFVVITTLICLHKSNGETCPCQMKPRSTFSCEYTEIIPTCYQNETIELDSIKKSTFNENICNTNIATLVFDSCSIISVHKYAFSCFRFTLSKLEMKRNKFKVLELAIFEELDNLVTLDLSYNSELYKLSGVFPRLPNLKNLYFDNCGLKILPENVFVNLDSLQVLLISDNNLKTLDPNVISQRQKGIIFKMHGNPFICDCKMRMLFNIMDVDERKKIICTNYQNMTWSEMQEDYFMCSPMITGLNFTQRNQVTEINEMTLSLPEDESKGALTCSAEGYPKPRIEWSFPNKTLKEFTITQTFTESEYVVKSTSTLMLDSLYLYSSNRTYQCIAYVANPLNSKQTNKQVTLLIPNPIMAELSKDIEEAGSNIAVYVLAFALCILLALLFVYFVWKCYESRARRRHLEEQSQEFHKEPTKMDSPAAGSESSRAVNNTSRMTTSHGKKYSLLAEESASFKDVESVRNRLDDVKAELESLAMSLKPLDEEQPQSAPGYVTLPRRFEFPQTRTPLSASAYWTKYDPTQRVYHSQSFHNSLKRAPRSPTPSIFSNISSVSHTYRPYLTQTVHTEDGLGLRRSRTGLSSSSLDMIPQSSNIVTPGVGKYVTRRRHRVNKHLASTFEPIHEVDSNRASRSTLVPIPKETLC